MRSSDDGSPGNSGSSPGGAYSNLWCSLGNADLALSVSLHPASTTASPEEVRDYRIGMIKAWPDGSYLANGHYRVCAAIPGQSLEELQDAEGALD